MSYVFCVFMIIVDGDKRYAHRYWRTMAESYEGAEAQARERHPGYSLYAVAKES